MDGGWGETNLFFVIQSAHVGIIGGIIEKTNVEKILQLNLLKTDFFADSAYPSYLYYNPYPEEKLVEVPIGSGSHDIYDAVSNTIISCGGQW